MYIYIHRIDKSVVFCDLNLLLVFCGLTLYILYHSEQGTIDNFFAHKRILNQMSSQLI